MDTNSSIESRALYWIVNGQVGISSKTIWSVMMGVEPQEDPFGNYPLDPDDFHRCHLLLSLIPEWKPRLNEVAKMFPEWKPLVENWAELESLFVQEFPSGRAPKLYDRMEELLNPMEQAQ